MWNNAVNAWWPLLFYRATDAPAFRKGMIAMICVAVATLVVTYMVWYLERREWRMRDTSGDAGVEDVEKPDEGFETRSEKRESVVLGAS